MVLLKLLEDQQHHQMTSTQNFEKIDFVGFSQDPLGLASVNTVFIVQRN